MPVLAPRRFCLLQATLAGRDRPLESSALSLVVLRTTGAGVPAPHFLWSAASAASRDRSALGLFGALTDPAALSLRWCVFRSIYRFERWRAVFNCVNGSIESKIRCCDSTH